MFYHLFFFFHLPPLILSSIVFVSYNLPSLRINIGILMSKISGRRQNERKMSKNEMKMIIFSLKYPNHFDGLFLSLCLSHPRRGHAISPNVNLLLSAASLPTSQPGLGFFSGAGSPPPPRRRLGLWKWYPFELIVTDSSPCRKSAHPFR